jgi:hypothetical protein
MHRGRNLDVITSADIRREHWAAIVAPAGFATAHLIAELVDAFCEPIWPCRRSTPAARRPASARRARPIRPRSCRVSSYACSERSALGPESETCIRCGNALARRAAWADSRRAGSPARLPAAPGRRVRAVEPEDVANFAGACGAAGGAVRPATVATPAAARAVEAFVTWHLGKLPKSSKLLDDLARA